MFGDPTDFAIEAMIEPHLIPPSSPWGRMRIWCQNTPMGNIDEECCGISATFDRLNLIAENVKFFWLDEFNQKSPIEIIDFLDAVLFGWCGAVELEDDRTIEQIHADMDKYGRFSFLTNWGEQFDESGKTFLLCPPTGGVHIVSRFFSSESNFSLLTTQRTFCTTVFAANDWFNKQRQALSRFNYD